jgi:hypothetical protein
MYVVATHVLPLAEDDANSAVALSWFLCAAWTRSERYPESSVSFSYVVLPVAGSAMVLYIYDWVRRRLCDIQVTPYKGERERARVCKCC